MQLRLAALLCSVIRELLLYQCPSYFVLYCFLRVFFFFFFKFLLCMFQLPELSIFVVFHVILVSEMIKPCGQHSKVRKKQYSSRSTAKVVQ